MPRDFIHTYRFELAFGGSGAVLFAIGAATGTSALAGVGPVLALLGVLGLGMCVGCLVHRFTTTAELGQKDEQIASLLQRPTRDAFDSVRTDLLQAREEVASSRAAMADLSGDLNEAQSACRKLAGELQRLQVSADLAQFSDFQLLAMADICDAEDVRGYLSRPLNDPAMEQLRALGIVSFDSSQDGSKDLKWTLVPEWRQAVRARRMQIDERTRSLRERRGEAIQSATLAEDDR